MGLFKKLKKAVKGVRKALHLPAVTLGNAAKVGLAAATGGAGVAALGGAVLRSRLKSAGVGGIKRALRTKAEKALVSRVAKLAPKVTAASTTRAVAMPGGAPLSKAKSNGSPSRSRKARRTTRRRAPSAPIARQTKRKAPKGGKDFKALSASWKAAGKPGTWLSWVKSH